MRVLADTSALLATAWRDDHNHQSARTCLAAMPRATFVVSDLIVAELATRLRARSTAERAAEIAENLLASRRYEVFFADRQSLAGAIAQMRRFADKRLSLTDCLSFELMVTLGLDGAFTFDSDFRDCGFHAVP